MPMQSFFGKKTGETDSGSSEKPMFNSKGPKEMADAGKVDTVIGPGSTVKGDIHSRGTLRVDGKVEGKVNSDSSIIIGEKGVVKAELAAAHIIIGGTVHGKVTGREKVEILSTGRLYGDVITKSSKFVVAEGVIFEGRCSMGQSAEVKPAVPKPRQPEAERQEVSAAGKG